MAVEKKSVLVIDDNLEMLLLFKTILEMEGYAVFTADTGKEALRILSGIDKPDLIFLDVKMDDLDGPDFLLMLEDQLPDLVREVPIVFLTGMDQVPKSKAVGFIRKPISNNEFLKATKHFIELGAGRSRYD